MYRICPIVRYIHTYVHTNVVDVRLLLWGRYGNAFESVFVEAFFVSRVFGSMYVVEALFYANPNRFDFD
jgi:hypothetical protein